MSESPASSAAAASAPRLRGPVHVSLDRCRRLDVSGRLEWLETNGLGTFAMGTISRAHIRRYNGLLVAALRPPVDRHVLISHLDDSVVRNGRQYDLNTNAYKDLVIQPSGYRRLLSFEMAPWPRWTWELRGATVVKEIIMAHGRQGVFVRYTYRTERADDATPARLFVRPVMAWREYHEILRESEWRELKLSFDHPTDTPGGCRIVPVRCPEPGTPEAALYPPAGTEIVVHTSRPVEAVPEAFWIKDFSYGADAYRGDPRQEDKYSPLAFFGDLKPGESVIYWFGLEDVDRAKMEEIIHAELVRRAALVLPVAPASEPGAMLARAADQFVARRGDRLSTILAGYPWFTDWGRDTMISLPGLLISTGRLAEAGATLATWASYVSEGMIPNHFPDQGDEPHYNTCDATLWFFEAAARYLAAGGDRALFDAKLWPAFQSIIDWHLKGTRFGIGVDPADGLLRAGTPGTQLTWMDAKYGDEVFTPRHGKPVEVNVLWVNALRLVAGWAKERGDASLATKAATLADQATKSFNARFWNDERACLYDVVDQGEEKATEDRIRPNQVFALSLERSPLAPERREAVLACIEEHLLTPMGLRSLAPGEPGYAPVYGGDRRTRDAQYHNGTVWGWLAGPYLSALFRVRGATDATHATARAYVRHLIHHLETDGVGQFAEIFDGDPPHRIRGCSMQAWSVAELIRAIVDHGLFTEL